MTQLWSVTCHMGSHMGTLGGSNHSFLQVTQSCVELLKEAVQNWQINLYSEYSSEVALGVLLR